MAHRRLGLETKNHRDEVKGLLRKHASEKSKTTKTQKTKDERQCNRPAGPLECCVADESLGGRDRPMKAKIHDFDPQI